MYYSLMKENRSETGRKSIGVLALVNTWPISLESMYLVARATQPAAR